jgi:hypothetical protein
LPIGEIKLRLLDRTFAEFDAAIEHAAIIEEHVVDDAGSLKELVLVVNSSAARGRRWSTTNGRS